MIDRITLTDSEDQAAFDRLDAKLGRWAIFAGGVAFGVLVTGMLGWIFG